MDVLKIDDRVRLVRRNEQSLPQCIICDLDGTLSLMNGRSPYKGQDCQSDIINPPVASVISLFHLSGVKIVLVSGRNSDNGAELETLNWLEKVKISSFIDKIYMRNPGDNRSDVDVKIDIYNNHIKGNLMVLFCLDDRKSVIRMWHDIGLPVFDVNPLGEDF